MWRHIPRDVRDLVHRGLHWQESMRVILADAMEWRWHLSDAGAYSNALSIAQSSHRHPRALQERHHRQMLAILEILVRLEMLEILVILEILEILTGTHLVLTVMV